MAMTVTEVIDWLYPI